MNFCKGEVAASLTRDFLASQTLMTEQRMPPTLTMQCPSSRPLTTIWRTFLTPAPFWSTRLPLWLSDPSPPSTMKPGQKLLLQHSRRTIVVQSVFVHWDVPRENFNDLIVIDDPEHNVFNPVWAQLQRGCGEGSSAQPEPVHRHVPEAEFLSQYHGNSACSRYCLAEDFGRILCKCTLVPKIIILY